MRDNFLKKSDSYKASHAPQYPPGTTEVYSYLESRGSNNPAYTETTYVGLQGILKEHFVGQQVTQEKINMAKDFWDAHFGASISGNGRAVNFNKAGWEMILNNHGGMLPLEIKAVAEGSVIPLKHVLQTTKNTAEHAYWLTNFAETMLMQQWYPITVATNSRECKKVILKYLHETGDPSLIPFKLHDFGFRGVSSWETSAIGGFAHLVNFFGTDTVSSIEFAMAYYQAQMCGFSVPATEHSTMTSWGKEHEAAAYANVLDIYEDSPLVSIVSDSYDVYNAVENIYGGILRDKIMNRKGTLVVRPDSGDPVEVNKALLEIMWNKFGGNLNSKGYKVLDPHVRIIQGDGIDLQMIDRILAMMKKRGFSADNMTFGSGGGLLQKFDRDTLKFAIKCSHMKVNGIGRDVFKDPITQKGKKSKRGTLSLHHYQGEYYTCESGMENPGTPDLLETVFKDGELVKEYSLDEIRQRAEVKPEELGIELETA